jgi:hypothetical protein
MIEPRLQKKIKIIDFDKCWEWTAHKDKDGYGKYRFDGTIHLAHRVVFYQINGFWPKECRHTCDNPGCCNPNHLLDGTHTENMQDRSIRGRNYFLNQTHCKRGHEYNEKNTYIKKDGARQCRPCANIKRR